MKKIFSKKVMGIMALAVACVMIGAAVGASIPASAASTVEKVASPYAAAVALVENSIVGVNNYQLVSNYYNNYGNGYGNFWGDFFGYGSPFGNGYGNGYGNGNGNGSQSQEVKYGSGSGVVVADRYVLTNYHVVDGANSLKVSISSTDSDEELLDATVAAYDEDLDVAVLYVPELNLEPVTIGDSDSLQVGDYVFNIGNPLSFIKTVTAGVVSGLNREIATSTTTDRYGRTSNVVNTMIQTDAAINSGVSGGGMFDTAGQLVGIPTLKYTGSRYSSNATVESIGMCIPINDAKPVIEQALANGGIMSGVESDTTGSSKDASVGNSSGVNDLTGRPRLGVSITTAPSADVLPRGALIMKVEDGGPAAEAGLQVGDIVVEADGEIITSTSDLMNIIATKGEGDTVQLKVYRTGIDFSQPVSQLPDNCDYVDITVTVRIVDTVVQ